MRHWGTPLRHAVAALWLAAFGPAGGSAAAPAQAHHDITWYVHEDLIDVGAGLTLAYYQALIEERLAQADLLLVGSQGPSDTACCVGLDAVSVATFAGVGLDVIENQTELSAVLAGPAGGYLVQSVWYCGGFSTSIRGCGNMPGDHLVVSLDAEDGDVLHTVIAHERGHNTGLSHVANDPCELMAGSVGGGCLALSECQSFIDDADSTSGACSCQADVLGDPNLPDAIACSGSFGSGQCSAAVCGESGGPAGTRLMASAGTANATTDPPDEVLAQSPLAGGWVSLGAFGAGVVPTGLAYDPSRDVVFALTPQAVGNDQLLTLDPETGAVLATVATLPYTGMRALAYDPAGDRLFATQVDAEIFGNAFNCGSSATCVSLLLEIDPDAGSSVALGELNSLIVGGGVQGLAWDSNAGVLYGSTAAGLFTIGLGCGSGACPNTLQVDNLFRRPSALAYDSLTDTLYRQGTRNLDRVLLEAIDPATGAVELAIGVDGFSVGGLAAIPVPEPERWLMLATGVALLTWLGRRRGVRLQQDSGP